jgi:hypothetical protein
MAAASGRLSKRFINAYLSFLVVLRVEDLPEELRKRFDGLQKEVSQKEARWSGEGSVEATVPTMHPKRIKALIEEIASIEYLLAQVYYD